MIAAAVSQPEANERRQLPNQEVLLPPQGFGTEAKTPGGTRPSIPRVYTHKDNENLLRKEEMCL